MGRKPKEGLVERILVLLSERRIGLTIEDVAVALSINRATASKYLFALESGQRILVRDVGKAKLHYPKTKEVQRCLGC
jgi:response regulator of citrate/malate metabolism